jgi:hypothetical protein
MTWSSLHRRFAALAAVCAIALQALWPLVAQAKPRAPGERVPICTIAGITHYLELPEVKTPLEQRSSSHSEHCQLCAFEPERGVLQAEAPVPSVVEELSQARPSQAAAEFDSPQQAPAQPRAPPVLS